MILLLKVSLVLSKKLSSWKEFSLLMTHTNSGFTHMNSFCFDHATATRLGSDERIAQEEQSSQPAPSSGLGASESDFASGSVKQLSIPISHHTSYPNMSLCS